MSWGGKFNEEILSTGIGKQNKRLGAPQGPIVGAPKMFEMGKDDQNLIIFVIFCLL